MSGATVSHNYTPAGELEGKDPFATTEAAPPAPPPAPPAPPPAPPTAWERLGAIFGKKKASALDRVKRTFLRIERDQKPVDDRALEAFALDLREAGITEAELSEWRGLLGKLAGARAAAARYPKLQADLELARTELAESELALQAATQRNARAIAEFQNRARTMNPMSFGEPLEVVAGKLAEIFPGARF